MSNRLMNEISKELNRMKEKKKSGWFGVGKEEKRIGNRKGKLPWHPYPINNINLMIFKSFGWVYE